MALSRYVVLAFAAFAADGTAAPPEPPLSPPPALLADAGDADTDEIDRAARVHGSASRVLRCWQEGRLIVERPVRSVPPESLRAVQLGDGREAMQLYDLRNSTCLIE